jgi:hypothetical protein
MRLHATRRAAIAQARGLGNPLWDLAGVPPSLDLRFAESKSLIDAVSGQQLITFSRVGSGGTFVNSAGLIETAAENVPRFTHDPVTLESLGLLVEEQRTNSLPNNTAQGAVAGSPGTAPSGWTVTGSANGLTSEIVQTGTEDGIAFVDIRYSGTTSGSGQFSILPSALTSTVAASGQTWTGSAYVKLQAGSLANLTNALMSANGRTAAGGGVESVNNTFTATADRLAVQRRTVTIALANANSERITLTAFAANYASGVAVDVTLRIGLPQLEQGAFATSVIPTSGTAVTRSADVASITGANFSSWFNVSEGTLFVSADRQQQIPATDFAQLFYMHDGSSNNTISLGWLQSGASQFRVRTAGVNEANLFGGTTALGRSSAGAYAANNAITSVNSGALVSDTTVALPTGINTVSIGSDQSGLTRHNGTIRRLVYWKQSLLGSVLQSITL